MDDPKYESDVGWEWDWETVSKGNVDTRKKRDWLWEGYRELGTKKWLNGSVWERVNHRDGSEWKRERAIVRISKRGRGSVVTAKY